MTELSFTQLAPGVGIGAGAPVGWRMVAERPLLVLVGVTGVGKSTTLAALADANLRYHLLPDRRDLTDRLIIPAMQARAGQPVAPVQDRKLRFEYTRAYRELYPGGMAHALAQLWIDPAALLDLLLFDGLRGESEVRHAACLLPDARFVVLEAPDFVRVTRLMGRGDPFDAVGGLAPNAAAGLDSFAALGVSEASVLFAAAEERALLNMVTAGRVSAAELRSSLAIVMEERRNYDPQAARAALSQVAPERTLVVNTAQHPPVVVADQICRFAGVRP
jgi:hypothetical protein